MKVAEVCPAGTDTVARTVAFVLSDAKLMVSAAGAGAERVTVAVELIPPTTVVGFNVTLATPDVAVIVRTALPD